VDDLSTLRKFLEHSRVVAFVAVNPDGTIDDCNRAFCRFVKRKPNEVIGEAAVDFLSAGDAESFPALLRGEWEPPDHLLLNVVDGALSALTLECCFERRGHRLILYGEPVQASEDALRDQLLEMNNQLAVLARETARKSAALKHAAEEGEPG
jgi:PAS domain-containing protein